MWLVNTTTYELRQFTHDEARRARYAILSHCWENDEVLFADMADLPRARKKTGWSKVKDACAAARRFRRDFRHGPAEWLWIDACCIDRSSSAEVSEAVNAMFAWYRDACICLAYLADVPKGDDPPARNSLFRKSRWFTRGWTLQELIAPDTRMVFLSHDWTELGRSADLAPVVEEITGVDRNVLSTWYGDGRLEALYGMSVAKRMSWSSGRETSRPEDRAYSLMGLFNIHMPVIYGEGGENAFRRLQLEIMRRSYDHSIFAWGDVLELRPGPPEKQLDWTVFDEDATPGANTQTQGLLASSPDCFQGVQDASPITLQELTIRLGIAPIRESHFFETNYGLRIRLPLRRVRHANTKQPLFAAALACRSGKGPDAFSTLLLSPTVTPDVYRCHAYRAARRDGRGMLERDSGTAIFRTLRLASATVLDRYALGSHPWGRSRSSWKTSTIYIEL